jgi:hypothetical protein
VQRHEEEAAGACVMRVIHVRNAVTPGNLVANIIPLNVRETRHIAITSSVNLHMCMCMLIYKAASMHWGTGDERRAENRPPRGCWGRAIFARSCTRTRSPISASTIELMYMKMHDDIPANWRTCVGALQTRARANSDSQEGWKRPRDTSTLCAELEK